MEEEKIGHLTVGVGTGQEREIQIVNRFSCEYADDRIISVSKLEGEEGYVIAVDNSDSSGRIQQSSMWLSEISLKGLMSTINLYGAAAKFDIKQDIETIVGSDKFNYLVQGDLIDPLQPPKTEE